ncbi:hypothetical protein GCM10022393_25010 [Aquimarina addita]|uniref:Uncharacterized protein n=1 Tax=Aquimarina addita TaxID=870485 RepID=A0ABP6UNM6_9FLAO
MNAGTLLRLSTDEFDKSPYTIKSSLGIRVFDVGAKWMFLRLHDLRPDEQMKFDDHVAYNWYGYMKYGVCLFAFSSSAVLLFLYNIWLLPLTVLLFYLVEVHFLFLFPLLIDKVKKPLVTSIKMVYSIGLFYTVYTVFRIGLFMMIGLLKYKNPFRNWYIGCLAIVIWYQKEVRGTTRLGHEEHI